MKNKLKVRKWDLINHKTLVQQRKPYMKDNHNPEWEETFANEDTHKEFISEAYRQLIQLDIRHKQPKTQMGQT